MQKAGDVNYLRNSVKAIVDAEGTVSFYISDPTDPIIRAYEAGQPSCCPRTRSCWGHSKSWAGAAKPQLIRRLDDAPEEYRVAQEALKTDDVAGYQQHIRKMVADLQQSDQLEHSSLTIPSGLPSPGPSPPASTS